MRILAAILFSCQAFGATLVWDPNPASEGVEGYKVYMASGGITNAPINVGNVTRMPLTNIEPESRHQIFVTAYNAAGESDPSDSLFYTAPPIPPGPVVLSNSLKRIGSTWQIDLAWREVAEKYAVKGYWITVNQDGKRFTNLMTTNLSASLIVPAKSPTTIYLQASNYVSLSSSTPVATFSQPGTIRTSKLTLP
jgi:hypothetical protein